MIDFDIVNDGICTLIKRGIVTPSIGVAKKPIPVAIKAVNKHALKHGVSREDAQSFIDNSVVMFDQVTRSLYVSHEGNAVLLDSEKRLISAYPKDEFDIAIKSILEVVRDGTRI
jgi:hypothetical protein